MSLPAGFVVGLLAGLVLLGGLRDLLARAAFLRTNYRGATLGTAAGLVIPLAMYACAAAVAVATALGATPDAAAVRSLTLSSVAVGGFAMLGLLDDLAVDRSASGYRGHIAALLRGQMSAGSIKMLVGPAVALFVVASVAGDSLLWLLVGGALVALAANVANLLDRAPGRTTKASAFGLLALVVAGAFSEGDLPALTGAAVAVGAAIAVAPAEMREQVMLGDTGANSLGAAVGLAVVLTQPRSVVAVVAVALLGLNLASERISFSRVIDRVAPLRAIDRLGRRPADG
jgi:UDP-N-acetylmuramyl pentapeptide phosphotransferase/UDP-N-acetylglucosamine-1-phosphate transferase